MNLNEHNLRERSIIDWFKQFGYKYKLESDIFKINY
jgi:hypothetical protein